MATSDDQLLIDGIDRAFTAPDGEAPGATGVDGRETAGGGILIRATLTTLREQHAEAFVAGLDAKSLIADYTRAVDRALRSTYRHFLGTGAGHHGEGPARPAPPKTALVAVGGYGRSELLPASDVDLVLVLAREPDERMRARIEAFCQSLWDLGLEIGHSVRTIEQCAIEARADITVATAMLESRRVDGSESLFQRMRLEATGPSVWSYRDYFDAKRAEQQARHRRFDDTAYKLEPNVKESPGGLRDIHTIAWVARHYWAHVGDCANDLTDLVRLGFATPEELASLTAAQAFLFDVRYALHRLARRKEDRLLFDYQRALAKHFGFADDDANLAVEQFMQRYYRSAMRVSQLNELLLELFEETMLSAEDSAEARPLNRRFSVRGGLLEASDEHLFERCPWSLLELFALLQQNPEIKGVRASTMRLVRAGREFMTQAARSGLEARSLFMEILRHPIGVASTLRRMHRFGVLAAYMPEFELVAGQMQFDLFHIYTVDEHTLKVVSNVTQYAHAPEDVAPEVRPLQPIFQDLPKRELLYLAAIFHDIAKGRGGDHSELGSEDAERFCLDHGLSRDDANLVSWLVANHLVMSVTSQRGDISDPDVINEFAGIVRDADQLAYLYLLTVADIRGTNPTLWNDWRATLLRTLYGAALRALTVGLKQSVDREALIAETQAQARLVLQLLDPALLDGAEALWRQLGDDYFLRSTADEIAWHAQSIAARENDDEPLVLARAGRGGTEVFVYVADQECLFAATCSALDRLDLSILDSRIITADNGMTLDSYVVVNRHGDTISDPQQLEEIQARITTALRSPPSARGGGTRLMRRELKAFDTATQIRFWTDDANARTAMEVITGDAPGLLARIGWTLADARIRLQNAKIATFGERAEDLFYITNENNEPLEPSHQVELEKRLTAVLDAS